MSTRVCRKLAITVKPLSYAACTRARTDANARGLLHIKPTKHATIVNEVIQMKTWKVKMPRRKTNYKTLKQAAEASGGGD